MTETTTQVERVARAIATANGDNFADAFTNKSRWIAKRGMSGGRYRDVNEPFQDDYREMATAAIKAMSDAEPVGWMYEKHMKKFVAIHKGFGEHPWSDGDREYHKSKGFTETPLYAAPQPHTAPIPHEAAPQGRDEVERLRGALEQIVRWDQQREWTATAENPETHWVIRDGQCAKIARAALSPPLS